MTIKIICFYTEGVPNDDGFPLKKVGKTIEYLAKDQGCMFEAYTPAKLQKMGCQEFIREYSETMKINVNPSMHKIGYSAWKPFIILHALQSMEEGDIVFYIDSNLEKYPSLRKFIENVKDISKEATRFCDFYIGRERVDQDLRLTFFANKHISTEIGQDKDFFINFPLCICNNIIARKSKFSEDILIDWLSLCRVERFLLPPKAEDRPVNLWWSTSEQSVANAVIARHVMEGTLPWFFPGISFGREAVFQVADNSHVALLAQESPWNTQTLPALREQFAYEINETKTFLRDVFSGKFNQPQKHWELLSKNVNDWKEQRSLKHVRFEDDQIVSTFDESYKPYIFSYYCLLYTSTLPTN